jgi:hypothetical protein
MFVLALLACTNDYLVVDGTDTAEELVDDSGIPEETWDGATLQILSPQSGDFIPWEQGGHFEAQIVDAEGVVLPFDEVTWESSEGDWTGAGLEFDADDLEVGKQDFTAVAHLPNGDRLRYTVGGVLVQSEYAGTYAGTMRVDVAMDAYTVACAGASTLVIDPEGEAVLGDASCLLSFQGFDLDGVFALDAQNDMGDVEGDIAIEIYGFEIPMELQGEVSSDGAFFAWFEGDAYGYGTFAGELDLVRVSRDTSYGE